uniref:Sugar phosphate phosphatase n=1 Tax=Meloidogyne enterolobii TaxID=390850 RepID=A0A6V7V0Z7_MELEN|nr:unnamed protein product [Meloidogyne enterolobii]
MGIVENLPLQITAGAKRPSFAFLSVTERWPKIIVGIVDRLHRYYNKAIEEGGQEKGDDVKSVISKLSEMRYRMMTDKPLEKIVDGMSVDIKYWNDGIDELTKEKGKEINWYGGPWLFVECYMYSKIQEFFVQTKNLKFYDPFREEKEKSYKNSFKYLLAVGTEMADLLDKNHLTTNDLRESLLKFLQISLWGNKCDLSLSGGDPHLMSEKIFHDLDDLKPNILVDDLELAVTEFLSQNKQIDVVLDNAGPELFTDLCLADFLISNNLANKIILHGKIIPWFVSDTTKHDLEWLLEQLSAESEPVLARFGKHWKNYLTKGIIEYKTHPFWTYGHAYCRMKEIAPNLYEELSLSSMLIFKGDLNYRKLVGDREWQLETPFKTALCGFEPAPLLALRTLKAETVAGLTSKAVQLIESKFERSNLTWMTSSEYAVVQLFVPAKK